MNLLYISEPDPWPLDTGGNIRHYNLIRQFATRHRVTLLTMTPPVRAQESSPYESICKQVIRADSRSLIPRDRAVRFGPFPPVRRRLWDLLTWWRGPAAGLWLAPEVVRLIRDVLADVRPDVVWADQSYVAEAVRQAGFPRIVADADDILSVYRYRDLRTAPWYNSKILHYIELAKLSAYEWFLSRRFWRIVVCKKEDKKFVGADCSRVFVVPNGIEPVPAMDPARERSGQMFFVGSLDYPPNADAAVLFAKAIFPRILAKLPEATFHIAGKRPDNQVSKLHDGRAIFMHGAVPSVDPHYQQASLFVSPLRQGAGTKLKILEALVRGKAVVATATSVEGLGLTDGVHFRLADRPSEFADKCVQLLTDPVLRRRLGAAGRDHVMRRFTWDIAGEMADRAVRF